MTISRRTLILGAGGGLALAGVAGVYRAMQMPVTAGQPWAIDPRPLKDVRLDAFRYAIPAPNPHNRQPWLIRLEDDDAATLFLDPSRRLPRTDPFDRQITIGFGAFIEIARMAAAARGVRMEAQLFPDGEAPDGLGRRPIVRLRFAADPGVARDPLFAVVRERRSNKEAYDLSRPVARAALAGVAAGDGHTLDPARLGAIRNVVLAAVTIEMETPHTHRESVDLIRIGHREVDASPDGIDLTGPMIELGQIAGLVDRPSLADPQSASFRSGLDGLRGTYGSIPALVWIATPGNSRREQIEAGRRYVRANLRATRAGRAMHPMSQSLQEYPEVAAPLAAVHRLCGVSAPGRIQMLARVGHGPAVPPSPRWPLATRIMA